MLPLAGWRAVRDCLAHACVLVCACSAALSTPGDDDDDLPLQANPLFADRPSTPGQAASPSGAPHCVTRVCAED